jgi:hypothetical protein
MTSPSVSFKVSQPLRAFAPSLLAERLNHHRFLPPRSSTPSLLRPITMSTTYGINEKVYCFHGPLIYEAKVRLLPPSLMEPIRFVRRVLKGKPSVHMN